MRVVAVAVAEVEAEAKDVVIRREVDVTQGEGDLVLNYTICSSVSFLMLNTDEFCHIPSLCDIRDFMGFV